MTAVPAETGRVRSRLSLTIAMACGLFGLAACGGGGGGPGTVLPDGALGAVAASPAPADPAPAVIGLSYTMEFVKAPDGSAAPGRARRASEWRLAGAQATRRSSFY